MYLSHILGDKEQKALLLQCQGTIIDSNVFLRAVLLSRPTSTLWINVDSFFLKKYAPKSHISLSLFRSFSDTKLDILVKLLTCVQVFRADPRQ